MNSLSQYCKLIRHSGTELDVVNTARISYGKAKETLDKEDVKLLKFLIEKDHGSPFEQTSLTFWVKCPIFVARQWMRHRVGCSYNEKSARYTETEKDFYVPELNEHYKNMISASCNNSYFVYEYLLSKGVKKEIARSVLPQAMYTEFYWTCNLRSFLHFHELRSAKGAQSEIRDYANFMLELVREHHLNIIKLYEDKNNG